MTEPEEDRRVARAREALIGRDDQERGGGAGGAEAPDDPESPEVVVPDPDVDDEV